MASSRCSHCLNPGETTLRFGGHPVLQLHLFDLLGQSAELHDVHDLQGAVVDVQEVDPVSLEGLDALLVFPRLGVADL